VLEKGRDAHVPRPKLREEEYNHKFAVNAATGVVLASSAHGIAIASAYSQILRSCPAKFPC
jgi:hypothetical protein